MFDEFSAEIWFFIGWLSHYPVEIAIFETLEKIEISTGTENLFSRTLALFVDWLYMKMKII